LELLEEKLGIAIADSCISKVNLIRRITLILKIKN